MLTNLNQATQPFAERGERILRNLDTSVEQLSRVLGGVAEALGAARPRRRGRTVQKFFTDPSLYNNLNDAACMITKVMPRVDRILRDVEVFADKIARHPETIGIGGAVRPSAGLKEGPSSSRRRSTGRIRDAVVRRVISVSRTTLSSRRSGVR